MLNAYKPSLGDGDLVTVLMWEPTGPTCSSWGGKSGSRRVHAARQPCPGAVVAAEMAGRWEVRGTWGIHCANALGARLLAAADPGSVSTATQPVPNSEPQKPCGRRNVYCYFNH